MQNEDIKTILNDNDIELLNKNKSKIIQNRKRLDKYEKKLLWGMVILSIILFFIKIFFFKSFPKNTLK